MAPGGYGRAYVPGNNTEVYDSPAEVASSPVSVELSLLGKSLEEISELLTRLEFRLSPVLTDVKDAVPNPHPCEPPPCPLIGDVRSLRGCAGGLVGVLNSINSRLAL